MTTYLDRRVREGFLLLPMVLNGEFKWLTHARWLEEYRGEKYVPGGDYDPMWAPISWLT